MRSPSSLGAYALKIEIDRLISNFHIRWPNFHFTYFSIFIFNNCKMETDGPNKHGINKSYRLSMDRWLDSYNANLHSIFIWWLTTLQRADRLFVLILSELRRFRSLIICHTKLRSE